MILLMTLYNRIEETGGTKIMIERSFKSKVEELTKEGHITTDVAKFALAYMIPNVKEKEIADIKEMAIKEDRTNSVRQANGYSKSANIDKINSILDKTMNPPVTNIDPCGHIAIRSSC